MSNRWHRVRPLPERLLGIPRQVSAVRTNRMMRQRLHQWRPVRARCLKLVSQAIDEAWAQITTYFGDDPVIIEGARLALASAILSLASDENRDVGALKHAGIQAITKQYECNRRNFKLRPEGS